MPRSALEVPNEIVRQIFAVFATTTLSTDKPTLFPFFLGHICSAWRCIFRSMTREFWHEISIIGQTMKYERTIDVLRFFLECNFVDPFSFYITSRQMDSDESDPMCPIMEMLVDQSMRWKTASFYIPAELMLPLLRIKNRLPLLQELHIGSTSCQDKDIDFEELRDVFRNAPSLNIIKIDVLRNWEFDLLNMKAVDVSMLRSGAFNFFAALPQMTKLERLEFAWSHDWTSRPSSIIILPNVTKLACDDLRWLQFLEAPSLEDLSINCHQFYTSDLVLSFLTRSSCNLNILRLRISRSLAATAIDVIRNTPKITYLQLVDISEIQMDSVLQQLSIPTNSGQGLLAPHLQSLYSNHYFPRAKINFLYDLISSRTDGTTDHRNHKGLQKLTIDTFNNPEITKNISVLCEERGVEFEFMC